MSTEISVPISAGELVDKITILEVKSTQIRDSEKLKNIETELGLLRAVANAQLSASESLEQWTSKLREVNQALWRIEDEIRECEGAKDFGPKFIELARSVYKQNDRRAALKKEINLALNSKLIEEKSYENY
jgi:hypothetical protein